MQQFPQYGSSTYHSTNGKSLAFRRKVIVALAVVSFIFWSACVGVPAGLCFNSVSGTTQFNGFLLVVANSAYIICTFQIVSLITSDDFPTHGGLKSLRSLIALFLAATVIGISVFISSTIHFATYDLWEDRYQTGTSAAFGCSFSCFWNFSMVIGIILYYRECRTVMAKATNFGNTPSASGSLGNSAANNYPMTSNGVPQIQILTESQQHQQQQQNVVLLPNNNQQGAFYPNRPTGSETSAPALSYVYVPQNRET